MKVVCAFIAHISNVPKWAFRSLNAGDDATVFVAKQYLDSYVKGINMCYTNKNEAIVHGLGLIAKFVDVHEYKVNMLSKTGVSVDGLYTYTHRQFERTIMGSNFTDKIRSGFTVEEHRFAITSGHSSWGANLPLIADYIEERKKLVHVYNTKRLDHYSSVHMKNATLTQEVAEKLSVYLTGRQ